MQSELSNPDKAGTNRVARVWHDSESADAGRHDWPVPTASDQGSDERPDRDSNAGPTA